MKSGRGRFTYELVFWLAIGALAFINRGLYKSIELALTPVLQAFTDVGMILILLATAFTIFYLKEAIWGTVTHLLSNVSGSSPLDYEKGNLDTNIQRSARRLEKKGDHMGAGEALESLEMWPEAAGAYERGNIFGKAANAWKLAGNKGKAIELYEKDGNNEAAGAICQSEGLQDRAAKNFRLAGEKCLEANQFAVAGDFYEKSGDYNKAGSIFEQAHKMDKALYCYEKSGNTLKILEIIKEIPTSEFLRRGPDFTQLLERCAENLASNGYATDAAQILEDSNSLIRAAELYGKTKMWEKSAELYLQAGRKDMAQNAINQIEDPKLASDISARLAMMNSDWDAAGKHFEDAGKHNQAIDAYKKSRNFEAAARIYENLGRFIMAGEMYSTGKNLTAAANAYAKAYDWRNAAECFEASGDSAQAIEAYSNSGNYLKAGMLAIKITDYARAIEYLQRIPGGSSDFRIGTAFLATAFFYQGQQDMAHELFARVMEDLPMTKDTLPVYYAYARNLEGDSPKKSLGLFRQILGVDLHFSDVADRAQRLEQIVTSMTSNFGNNTPIPVTSNGIIRQSPLAQTPPPAQAQAQTMVGGSGVSYASAELSANPLSTSAPSMMASPSAGNANLLDGRYKLGELLDQSGRIMDYKALDTTTGSPVIVRTFPTPDDDTAKQATMKSLSAARQISHPNIVNVTNFGENGDSTFVVSEIPAGTNLKQWIKSNGPVSIDQLKTFAGQFLNSLSYVHSNGVYHLNLRPEVVYINQNLEDRLQITGFGKPVRRTSTAESLYQTMPDSDPQYLAPEQIVGGNMDERTDIYAVGLVLFYILTARTPFEVKRINDTQEIARMQVQVSLTRPSSIRATLPSVIDDIFLRCVSKSPTTRYQSAQELLKDINAVHTETRA